MPILTPGNGAGAGAIAGFQPGSRDDAGIMLLQAGSVPAISSIVLAFQFDEPYENPPISVILTPANENAAQLGAALIYVPTISIAVNGFSLFSTSVPIPGNIEYFWSYMLKF